ncbi:unnamed protein product [Camellia sinensis]
MTPDFHFESKQEFNGNCSVQVYSVQACIPKDPAALWNAEFVQAEELLRQPLTIDNCLRDNRLEKAYIDAADVDNELAVVEYVEDIYKFYKLTEGES